MVKEALYWAQLTQPTAAVLRFADLRWDHPQLSTPFTPLAFSLRAVLVRF